MMTSRLLGISVSNIRVDRRRLGAKTTFLQALHLSP